ncbi:hypothetical protein FA15DRAFT_674074 [Coprinopsis marcescibilis]|uniref:Uncharacterized protein n=1 Tax=Coprinopsis marcescibilis TaxID=230819 RepID=A0A5C3KIC6_COPMA|nr:hypothetical protein FA15DRAFT_674074 [Coprinopsis marcescibilis]
MLHNHGDFPQARVHKQDLHRLRIDLDTSIKKFQNSNLLQLQVGLKRIEAKIDRSALQR